MILFLGLTLIVTVSLLVRAENHKLNGQIYFFKPLSTLLVIAVALFSLQQPGHNITYSSGVLVGLALCFGGDVALMFKQRNAFFLGGLVLFLLGHVAYTITFSLLGQWTPWDLLSAGILLVAALLFYRLLLPGLGDMRLPVIAYTVVISLMVHRALSLLAGDALTVTQTSMVIGGAILFFLSDMVLGADRFWRPLKYNNYLLVLYYGGQFLIALAAVDLAGLA